MESAKVNDLNPEAWLAADASKTISTEDLDNMIIAMKKARDIYDAAKSVATEKYKTFEELEGKVVEALKLAGKRKYHVDGLGVCYFIEKLVVTTPKTLEDKRKFFDWLKSSFGETFLLDKQGVNHQSLQKIYNDAYNAAVEEGKGEQFTVPGLDSPTAQISLGFRKEK